VVQNFVQTIIIRSVVCLKSHSFYVQIVAFDINILLHIQNWHGCGGNGCVVCNWSSVAEASGSHAINNTAHQLCVCLWRSSSSQQGPHQFAAHQPLSLDQSFC
jgi:hypothetical protein